MNEKIKNLFEVVLSQINLILFIPSPLLVFLSQCFELFIGIKYYVK